MLQYCETFKRKKCCKYFKIEKVYGIWERFPNELKQTITTHKVSLETSKIM